MRRTPSFYKNMMLGSVCLFGLLWVLLAQAAERTTDKGLMSSFRVEMEQLKQAGELTAWKNEEEGTYYIFLPSGQTELSSKVRISTSFQEFGLEIEGITADENGFFECQPDRGYQLNWKLFHRFTVASHEIIFVQSKQIPAFFLQTAGGEEFQEETADKNSFQQLCGITIIGADGEVSFHTENAIVSGRGNSTWAAAKKPLKFKLSQAAGLLGMEEAVNYNLIANAYDGSHMRNKIMMDMSNAISRDFMADGEWVELYYNGEYEGLYLLAEKVEIAENRLDIVSLEEKNEEMNPEGTSKYKEFKFEETYQGMTIKGVEIPYSPKDITGSYLLEIDMRIRYEQEASGIISEKGQSVTIDHPKYASRSEMQYLADLLADVESAIYSEKGISEISGKKLEELIDMESFADAYLYGEIAGEQDTGISSQYFYKRPDEESPLLYAGSIWDFDGSLGNTNPEMYAWPECLCVSAEEVRGEATGISNKWFAALCKQDVFMDKVKERFQTVFYEKGYQVLNEKITKYAEKIRKAALRDRLRWNGDSGNWPFIWPDGYAVEEGAAIGNYYVYDRLDSQVSQITEFLQRKLDFLYDLWVNETVYYQVYVKPEADFLSDTMFYGRYYWVKEGECLPELPYYTSEWYQGESYERTGYFLAETGEEAEVTLPVYRNMNIIDKWEKGD